MSGFVAYPLWSILNDIELEDAREVRLVARGSYRRWSVTAR